MRYDIRYRCAFSYEEPAAESHNELRVCPSTVEGQTVLHARVLADPSARVLTTIDYWGTRVDAFGVRAPHDALEVVVEATVEVDDVAPPPESAPLDELRARAFLDGHREFLGPSEMIEPDETVEALSAEIAPNADDVVALATALCAAVEERIDHEPGAAEVGTTVGAVLEAASGVCQDRAHLLIALCRLRGIPARYVSGYLCAGPSGHDTTTHAWVEVAVPDHGWLTLDPSDGDVDDQHRIVIGRGRDYADVSPLRGTYIGGEVQAVDVAVEITEVTPVAG